MIIIVKLVFEDVKNAIKLVFGMKEGKVRSPAKGNRTRFVCSALLKLSFQFVRRSLEETPVHAVVGLDRRGDVPVFHQHLDDLGILLHL